MNHLLRARSRVNASLQAGQQRLIAWSQQPDRGDVPGWVLITVMTAGLVAAIWFVAEPLLANLFSESVSGVTGP